MDPTQTGAEDLEGNAPSAGAVENQDTTPEPKLRYGSMRDEAYNDLVARRQKSRAPAAPAPEPATVAPEPEGDDMEEVRVFPEDPDGFIGQVSRREIAEAGGKEAYGKRKAADIILARQKDALKRAKDMEAQLQAERDEWERKRREVEEASKAPTGGPEQDPDGDVLDDDVQSKVEKYREEYGDEIAELAELAYKANRRSKPAPTPAVDPDEIAARAAITAREEIKREEYNRRVLEADAAFAERYPHLAEDPRLFNLAVAEYKSIMEKGETDPMKGVLKAGENIDEWVGKATKRDPGLAQKQAQKQSISPSIRAAESRMPRAPEPKPETASSIVANMRKRRGLPV